MRLVLAFVSLSLLSAAAAACTAEVVAPAPANQADGGAPSSGESKPRPPSSASKDGGASSGKSDAGSQAGKPQTCSAAADCISECEGDEDTCSDTCFGALPEDELADLYAASMCITNSGCTDQACVEDKCGAEIAACLAD